VRVGKTRFLIVFVCTLQQQQYKFSQKYLILYEHFILPSPYFVLVCSYYDNFFSVCLHFHDCIQDDCTLETGILNVLQNLENHNEKHKTPI
jgi:hypothetical protein